MRRHKMLKIINGKIISGGEITEAILYAEGGRIVEISNADKPADKIIDAKGNYVSPGFIDTHVHGGGGADVMDATAEAICKMAKTHLKYGTTSICPTTAASTHENLLAAVKAYMSVLDRSGKDGMPNLVGLHLEGPNFSPAQAGAQDPENIYPPRRDEYTEIISIAEGHIAKWSFAPELPGSEEFCDYLTAHGILPCIGHTDGTYDDVMRVYPRGAKCLTHFYSGMSGITRVGGYRIPGVIESGYILDGMWLEIIGDGAHIPPLLLKMICKLKGTDKIMLVTDAMRGATMPEGPSILGAGTACIIEDGIAKMPDRTCFAGSVATTDRLVRTLYKKAEIPLPKAVDMMTKNPALAIGLKSKGELRVGFDADIVIFDDDINIKSVIVLGNVVI